MEELEYTQKLKKLEEVYLSDKKALHIEFALSNAKFKKGDIIIEDSKGIILIDKITTYIGFGLPEPVYHGLLLKKDLTPKKNGEREAIYGNRCVELIKSA